MGRYVLNRLIQSLPTLIGLTIVSFLLVHIVPGGPAYTMLGAKATPERVAAIDRTLGLNYPVWVQYVRWLGELLQGNFGFSYFTHESVMALIGDNLPRTLAMVGLAVVFAHILAIVLGSLQAYYKNSWLDHVLTIINYLFYSMPIFWLGIIVLLYFSMIGLHHKCGRAG